jgi:hypothetical protein
MRHPACHGRPIDCQYLWFGPAEGEPVKSRAARPVAGATRVGRATSRLLHVQ